MVVVHVEMILAVAGGAVTHQTQVPLGLTQAPTSSGGWDGGGFDGGGSSDAGE